MKTLKEKLQTFFIITVITAWLVAMVLMLSKLI